ncbi:MAG: acyl-CoA dehydrogenase family protein [Thermodesulfobacteriota bacterium]|nr:acyl-CoA dehydrogenase family protein [Thermodesulfobacteriota bacterium]
MDFELTSEHQMLKDMTYRFAKDKFPPLTEECDREEKYTRDLVTEAAEVGLVGAWIPEEYGGAGMGSLGNALITEQISRVDMAIGHNIWAASFGCEDILHYGSEEQKKTYLPKVCKGEWISAGAFTEPNAGTDVAGYTTRAVKDGNDYVITGNKIFITNATYSDFMLVQCITNPDAKRHDQFSQIIVPTKTKGVTTNHMTGKLGLRSSDTSEVAFDEVRVPQANLVGTEGKGFKQLMNLFDTTRVWIAGQCLGLSEACLEESVKYVKQRMAFGKPLGSFQISQMKLTEMAVNIEALRGMVYKAGWLIDNGNPDFTLSAMAKYFGGKTAVSSANYAVELHGSYGYFDDYPVQKWYRDAKILELYEGTKEAEIMTLGRHVQKD